MGKAKVWERRWSVRKNKYYYVNIDTRTSSWRQPPDFVETSEKGIKTRERGLDREKGDKKAYLDNAASAVSTPSKRKHECDSSDSENPIRKAVKLERVKDLDGEKGDKKEYLDNAASAVSTPSKRKHESDPSHSEGPIHKASKLERVKGSDREKRDKKEYLDNAASTPSKRKHESDSSDSENPIHKAVKLESDKAEEKEEEKEEIEGEMKADDYTTVFSEKRQISYYYNYRTKKSQWKKPACLQEIDTQKAIEKHRAANLQNLNNNANVSPKVSPKVLVRKKVEKKVFETPKSITKRIKTTLDANAKPFIPSWKRNDRDNEASPNQNIKITSPHIPDTAVSPHEGVLPRTPDTSLSSPSTPSTPLSPREKRRSIQSPCTFKRRIIYSPLEHPNRRHSEPITKVQSDKFLKEDRSRCTDVKKRLSDPIHKRVSPDQRVTSNIQDRLSDPIRKRASPDQRVTSNIHNRLSDPTHKRVSPDQRVTSHIYDRLGRRRMCTNTVSEDPWDFDIMSNVRLEEGDLNDLRSQLWLPPLPSVELFRFSQVQQLRDLFVTLCKDKLKIDEPMEAFNRWLLEQQLSQIEQRDPLLCYSEKKSTSLFREIMEDVPRKFVIPRSQRHCSTALKGFVECMQNIVIEHSKSDDERSQLTEILNDALEKNDQDEAEDTRDQIALLRKSCQHLLDRVYNPIVGEVCEEMKDATRVAAQCVYDMASKQLCDEIKSRPLREATDSTKLVFCQPAMMCTPAPSDLSMEHISSGRDGIRWRLKYKDEIMCINTSHMKKLKRLYEMSCTDDLINDKLEIRVWCLLKRYDMLRASMSTGYNKISENFGLHAALPTKAFRVLAEEFHVTFECFASPLNSYYKQYCSAFPDIDCYFGSRGSFFDFRPQSGAFQANPPFSEEVMSAMADHMIDLLTDTDEPLMFVIFIPDWREPVTPALIKLEDSVFCRNSRLIEKGRHQYITGRQHIQSRDSMFYAAAHGTMVFVLQSQEASRKWEVTELLMNRLEDAMCSSRNKK